jgi:hypothetical protein
LEKGGEVVWRRRKGKVGEGEGNEEGLRRR